MTYRVKLLCIILAGLLMQIASANAETVSQKMGEVFLRTMKHWNYSYSTLDTT